MGALIPSRFVFAAAVTLVACVAVAENIGPDDRQVSITGPAGSAASDAVTPALAFDPVSQRYLLVWSADANDGDFLVHGQLLSGGGGEPIGPSFVISPIGTPGTDHRQPAVAFSPAHGRFLVVWSSDVLNSGANEILGRMVNPAGRFVSPVWRYSDMGTEDENPAFDAVTPDLAWHPDLDAFVLVWAADDDTGGLGDGRFEIYGQLATGAMGVETGANDFRISFSTEDDQGNDVLEPSVAVLPGSDRWFVAFEADVHDDGNHWPEIWMYGCTTDVPDPAAVQVSAMGAGIADRFAAYNPDLIWDAFIDEFVCLWDGDAGDGVRAVYGQRIQPDGALAGGRMDISAGAGTPWGDLREAIHPRIVIDPPTKHWFVTWAGDTDDGHSPFDHEIWARRFDGGGGPVEPGAFSLSAMDPAHGPVAGAGAPVVAANPILGYKLVAWAGDLDTTPLDEGEIFTQAWADDGPSGVDDGPSVTPFALAGASPNPFNPVTTIAWDMPAPATASLRVYDAAGQLVRTLLAAVPRTAGRNEQVWNGRDDAGRQVAAGVYFYRLDTAGRQVGGRMTLVK